MRKRRVLAATLALVLVAPGSPARAQLVVGRVVDSQTAEPIDGAFLVLLDASERRLARTLTHADGSFVLRAERGGRYQILTQRIGYEDHRTGFFDLDGGQTLELRIDVASQAISLKGFVVEVTPGACSMSVAETEERTIVWGEARKALEVAQWGEEMDLLPFKLTRITRELDKAGRRVESEVSWSQTVWGFKPYWAAPAETLEAKGYVRGEAKGDQTFYAPDADVLLSDSFLDSHCFHVTRSPGRVGLAFEPVPTRDLPDVEGVLWLDEETAELQVVEFRFTGVDVEETDGLVGGEVEFLRIREGVWIVERWALRVPLKRVSEDRQRVVMVGVLQEEGLVDAVELDPGIVWGAAGVEEEGEREVLSFSHPVGALTGMVYDSLRERGLDSAFVGLDGTEHWAVTDDDGSFVMENIRPGTFTLVLLHPRLTSLGFGADSSEVTVAPDSTTTVDLGVPTLRGIAEARCDAQDLPQDVESPAAILMGILRDEATGAPVNAADLELTVPGADPPGGADSREVVYRTATDAAGFFVACRVPLEDLEMRVRHLGRDAGLLVVGALSEGEIRHVRMSVRMSTTTRVVNGGAAPAR